jgi:hypothetical protein
MEKVCAWFSCAVLDYSLKQIWRLFADREPKFANAARATQKVLNLLIGAGYLPSFTSFERVRTDSAAKNFTHVLNDRSFDGTISSFAIYLREASVVELATSFDAQARSCQAGCGAWIKNPILDK